MKLNEKIYTCRKKAGLSQDALAERLGVSRQAISKWELGTAQPELDNLAALARTFGVTTDWLLADDFTENDGISTDSADPSDAAPPPFCEAPPVDPIRTYPDWMDKLPHTLGMLCKRFGWLLGVYLSVIGSFFAGFGILVRVISSVFFHNAVVDVQSATSSESFMIEGFDNYGNPIPDEVLRELYEQFSSSVGYGGMFGFDSPFDMYNEEVARLAENNPLIIMGNVLIIFGGLLIVLGIVTAILLRRYSKKSG